MNSSSLQDANSSLFTLPPKGKTHLKKRLRRLLNLGLIIQRFVIFVSQKNNSKAGILNTTKSVFKRLFDRLVCVYHVVLKDF